MKTFSTIMIASILSFGALSCKKSTTTTTTPTPSPTSTDIASLVVGDYKGSGENPSGSFVMQTVKVSKINNTRIQVENAAGSTAITTFQVDIMQAGNFITQTVNESTNSIAFNLSASPITLAFDTYGPDQDFGGQKQ